MIVRCAWYAVVAHKSGLAADGCHRVSAVCWASAQTDAPLTVRAQRRDGFALSLFGAGLWLSGGNPGWMTERRVEAVVHWRGGWLSNGWIHWWSGTRLDVYGLGFQKSRSSSGSRRGHSLLSHIDAYRCGSKVVCGATLALR
jgi:hypothetical protein